MGAFLDLFGDKQEKAVAQHDRAVLELKTQRDELKKYMKRVVILIGKEVETAKKLLNEGRRDTARLCLRKKKNQENLLKQADANLQNIEEMINSIEFAQVQHKIFESLKQGNEALKKLQTMSVEDVEELLLDTKEAIEHQQEIDRLLSEQLTPEDDADILKELQDLQSLPEEIPEEPLVLPDVPEHPLPTKEPARDDEMVIEEEETVSLRKTKAKTKQAILG